MNEFIQLAPILMMVGIFYFMVIRPQVEERKAHDALCKSLTKDDVIVTNAGFHGKIVSVKDDIIVIEAGKGVHLTVDRAAVARRIDPTDSK